MDPSYPPDALDLVAVQVEGSDAGVLSWPVAATLREAWIHPGAVHLRVDHPHPWPPVSIEHKDSTDDDQEATFWLFVPTVSGKWIAGAADRLRPGQITDRDKPAPQSPRTACLDWFYNTDIWPRLRTYQPQDLEIVGVMVTAGQTRAGLEAPVQERTNIVTLQYHASTDQYDRYEAPVEDKDREPWPAKPPDQTPATGGVPGVGDLPLSTEALLAIIRQALEIDRSSIREEVLGRLDRLEAKILAELERETNRVLDKATQVGGQLAAGMQAPALRELLGGLFRQGGASPSAPDPPEAAGKVASRVASPSKDRSRK